MSIFAFTNRAPSGATLAPPAFAPGTLETANDQANQPSEPATRPAEPAPRSNDQPAQTSLQELLGREVPHETLASPRSDLPVEPPAANAWTGAKVGLTEAALEQGIASNPGTTLQPTAAHAPATALPVVASAPAPAEPTAGSSSSTPVAAVTPAPAPEVQPLTAEEAASARKDMNHERWLEAAGLDWEVVKTRIQKINSLVPDVRNGPTPLGSVPETVLPKYVAIVNRQTDQVFGIMKENYCPMQNQQMHRILKEGGFPERTEVEKVHVDGPLIAIMAKHKELSIKTDGKELDVVMLITNAHDGSRKFSAMPMIRLPKAGMIPALTADGRAVSAWNLRHSSRINDHADRMVKMWGEVARVAGNAATVLNHLSTVELDKDGMKGLLVSTVNRVFKEADPEQREITMARLEEHAFAGIAPGSKVSMFEFIDRVAAYADQKSRVRRSRGRSEDEARMTSVVDGSAARFKKAMLSSVHQHLEEIEKKDRIAASQAGSPGSANNVP